MKTWKEKETNAFYELIIKIKNGTLTPQEKKDLKTCLIFFSAVIGLVLLKESYPNEFLWGAIILTVIVFFVFIVDWSALYKSFKKSKKEEDKKFKERFDKLIQDEGTDSLTDDEILERLLGEDKNEKK